MSLISLSEQERTTLQDSVKRARDGRVVRRAQALLWLDSGEPVRLVAQRLVVSRQTIYTWVKHFLQRHSQTTVARLQHAPRSGRPPAKREAVQMLIRRTPPPEDNPDTLPWRSPEIRRLLHNDGIQVSTRTVRRGLRALGYRYKRPRDILARRSPTWRQAKGGSSAA